MRTVLFIAFLTILTIPTSILAAGRDGFHYCTSQVNDTIETDSASSKIDVFQVVEHILATPPAIKEALADSLSIPVEKFNELSNKHKRKLVQEYLAAQIEDFNNVDTNYIEPQHQNFMFMLNNSSTFEQFSMASTGENHQQLKFAPNPTFRLGGYISWHWMIVGYMFDMKGLLGGKPENTDKKEFDISFYTSRVGGDIYYRKTGNDFRCTNLNSIFSSEQPRPSGISDEFNALEIDTRGFNLYYIFNYKHFSYPAAFAQSTVQRRSCGSFKMGLSYIYHKVTLDMNDIDPQLLPYLSKSLYFNQVLYHDYAINFGYAYNWVFARNFLLSGSIAPAVSYTVTRYDGRASEEGHNPRGSDTPNLRDFNWDKVKLDFVFRAALVYNNSRYFAGSSFILHTFDYSNPNIRLTNSFGSLNFYIGLYFGKDRRKK